MKFISWNVNGLRACVKKGFTEFFEQTDADFFCIQETKLQEGQIDFAPEGYFCYWNYAVKKGYSGTAIFAKKEPLNVQYGIGIEEHDQEGRVITLEYENFYMVTVYTPNSQGTAIFAKKEPLNVQYGIGIEEHDQEGRVITLEYENFYMVTVYTPNSQSELARLSYRMQWEEDFRNYLQKLDKKKPVVMCGDLNVAHKEIDLKNPKTNRHNAGFTDEEREKFTTFLEAGFTDTFRYFYPDKTEIYSWWSYRFKAREKNAGWRIDYFCTSKRLDEKLVSASIHTEIFGSDHCPVEVQIEL